MIKNFLIIPVVILFLLVLVSGLQIASADGEGGGGGSSVPPPEIVIPCPGDDGTFESRVKKLGGGMCQLRTCLTNGTWREEGTAACTYYDYLRGGDQPIRRVEACNYQKIAPYSCPGDRVSVCSKRVFSWIILSGGEVVCNYKWEKCTLEEHEEQEAKCKSFLSGIPSRNYSNKRASVFSGSGIFSRFSNSNRASSFLRFLFGR
jgi:hypothetical protein